MIKTFMIRGESPSHTSSQRNHRSKRTAGHVKGAASLMEPKSSISARSTTCDAHTVRRSSGTSVSRDEAAEKGRKAGGEACSFTSI